MAILRGVVLGFLGASICVFLLALTGAFVPDLTSHVDGGQAGRTRLAATTASGFVAGVIGGGVGAGQARRALGESDPVALWLAGLAGPALACALLVLLLFDMRPVGPALLGLSIALVGGGFVGTASSHRVSTYLVERREARPSVARPLASHDQDGGHLASPPAAGADGGLEGPRPARSDATPDGRHSPG